MAIWREIGPTRLLSIAGPPTVFAITAGLLHILPSEVLNFFTAWLLTAFPMGLLMGHFVLSED